MLRRTFIQALSTIPLIGFVTPKWNEESIRAKWNNDKKLWEPFIESNYAISTYGKYLTERRYDVINRFFDLIIDSGKKHKSTDNNRSLQKIYNKVILLMGDKTFLNRTLILTYTIKTDTYNLWIDRIGQTISSV